MQSRQLLIATGIQQLAEQDLPGWQPDFPTIESLDGTSLRFRYADGEEAHVAYLTSGRERYQDIIRLTLRDKMGMVIYASKHNWSDRGIDWFASTVWGFGYPPEVLTPERLNGKVLDIATGGGKFVRDLRERGVEAYGLDMWLEKDQLESGNYFLGLAHRTGFPDGWVKDIFLNTVTHYGMSNHYRRLIIEECLRVAELGGSIWVTPVLDEQIKAYEEIIEELPGRIEPRQKGYSDLRYLEIVKHT